MRFIRFESVPASFVKDPDSLMHHLVERNINYPSSKVVLDFGSERVIPNVRIAETAVGDDTVYYGLIPDERVTDTHLPNLWRCTYSHWITFD